MDTNYFEVEKYTRVKQKKKNLLLQPQNILDASDGGRKKKQLV